MKRDLTWVLQPPNVDVCAVSIVKTVGKNFIPGKADIFTELPKYKHLKLFFIKNMMLDLMQHKSDLFFWKAVIAILLILTKPQLAKRLF